MDLKDAVITGHATVQIKKRGIAVEQVRMVLAHPDDVMNVRPGRVVAQGIVGGRLLRVFVDVDRSPPAVVTAYLTSKIEKYRSKP